MYSKLRIVSDFGSLKNDRVLYSKIWQVQLQLSQFTALGVALCMIINLLAALFIIAVSSL